jgi:hypothetical protein
MINNESKINSNTIKVIAIIAMTVDHLAWTFFPGFRTDLPILFLHICGRLTMPIMAFCIVEGYHHTKNLKKYILRLLVLAFISHFSYALLLTPGKLNMALNNQPFFDRFIPFKTGIFDQTSVIWTYLLGLIALAVYNNKDLKSWHKQVIIWLCMILAFIADWSTPAAVAILYMGRYHGKFKTQMFWFMVWMVTYAVVYAVFLNITYGVIQIFVVLAVPILYLYNGRRGKWKGMKWFFYVYYPLHLAILGIIGLCINR